MTEKFKLGPAKTRDGHDAVIFEISDDGILGKMKPKGDTCWGLCRWAGAGLSFSGMSYDLMPNAEPHKVTWETGAFEDPGFGVGYGFLHPSNSSGLAAFIGKKVRVTVEEIP